ncbi:hypothetical protein EX895_001300 [Sporisorium graminicola]|uniref:Phytanoyl-CoA dioxygenase n=1 Tax=Sporisorium graminicola TaxID=280036 RepID=A0A4U7L3M6_9BASI|nr:hypothetical protein EX895_001300 [Sporisorium graminicola]TKY90002.1 hypothetical protein EX895_001300 [Sporisorium graminicola]
MPTILRKAWSPMRGGHFTSVLPHASRIRSVKPSPSEKTEGMLSRRNLQSALEALHHDGIVVLENIIDPELLDRLNERMTIDTRALIAKGDEGPFNYNLGNLQQSPPYELDYFAPSIFFNPLATSLSAAYLGGKPTVSFISSNAAVKADEGQPVHSDADFDHPSIPFATVVNVGLVDMQPSNGSTQLWLGTHSATSIQDQQGLHGERASGRIRQELLDARSQSSPPLQPTVAKGSVVVRDLRLWHAGMPNRTNDIRIMLAMIHFAPWYRQRMTLDMPKSFEPLIAQQSKLGISIPARFQADTIDHLNAGYGNSFDFDQDA